MQLVFVEAGIGYGVTIISCAASHVRSVFRASFYLTQYLAGQLRSKCTTASSTIHCHHQAPAFASTRKRNIWHPLPKLQTCSTRNQSQLLLAATCVRRPCSMTYRWQLFCRAHCLRGKTQLEHRCLSSFPSPSLCTCQQAASAPGALQTEQVSLVRRVLSIIHPGGRVGACNHSLSSLSRLTPGLRASISDLVILRFSIMS